MDYEWMKDDVSKRLSQACQGGMPSGEIRVGPSRTVLPKTYLKHAEGIRTMEVRPDDVWVISYPKCGTTWTQEMVWLLGNNCDFDAAKATELYKRFLFLEYTALGGDKPIDTLSLLNNFPSPRYIKTHLPVDLLPAQLWTVRPKVIYVYRNPKDVAISYFHHFRLWNGYTGSQEEFLEAFVQDKVVFSPFWNHVLAYWSLRDEPNHIFNSFEEMKSDLTSVIQRTAAFMGVTVSEENLTKLLDHLSFASMSKNPATNFEAEIREAGMDIEKCAFIRQGESGAWRKVLTDEMANKFDKWSLNEVKRSDFQMYKTSQHITIPT